MSDYYRLNMRERWGARSMVLKRWHVHKWFDPNSGPLCEIEVDGSSRLIHYWDYGRRLTKDDRGDIYHFFVAEGSEIGPHAELFEYGDGATEPPVLARQAPLHALAKLRLARRNTYPKIFINYRRDDADAYAGRLHEVLAHAFGEDQVFFAEFSIRPGEVWDWTIQQAVVHARVVLALVGRRWLAVEDNRRRIDDPSDIVRREIVAALDRGTPVLPVLLPEAAIPRDFDSRHELQMLPQLQFHRLTGARHWRADVALLVTTIREHLGGTEAKQSVLKQLSGESNELPDGIVAVNWAIGAMTLDIEVTGESQGVLESLKLQILDIHHWSNEQRRFEESPDIHEKGSFAPLTLHNRPVVATERGYVSIAETYRLIQNTPLIFLFLHCEGDCWHFGGQRGSAISTHIIRTLGTWRVTLKVTLQGSNAAGEPVQFVRRSFLFFGLDGATTPTPCDAPIGS